MYLPSDRRLLPSVVCLTILLSLYSFACHAEEKPAKKNDADKKDVKWTAIKMDKEHWETCNFGGDGELDFKDGQIICDHGDPMTGIKLKKPFPKDGFEVEFEAIRLDGFDFFVGFTFPVADKHCSLILGGWSGTIVGLSNIDGYDASDNPTTTFKDYDNNRWYKVKVLVEKNRIAAWVNGEKVVDHPRKGFKFDIRGEMDASTPLGISTFQCQSAYRKFRYRALPGYEKAGKTNPND